MNDITQFSFIVNGQDPPKDKSLPLKSIFEAEHKIINMLQR